MSAERLYWMDVKAICDLPCIESVNMVVQAKVYSEALRKVKAKWTVIERGNEPNDLLKNATVIYTHQSFPLVLDETGCSDFLVGLI